MKKLILTIALIACTISNTYSQKEISYETVDVENYDRSLPMPNGTKILQNEDGSNTIVLPDGDYYIAKAVGSGEIVTMFSGSVTCTCNSGSGGCHPCKAKGQYGCLMNNCSNCSKSAITNPRGGKDKQYDILGIAQKEIAPLRLFSNKKVSDGMLGFVKTDDIPFFNNCNLEIMKYKEASEAINLYIETVFTKEDVDRIKDGKEPAEDIEYALADFYGNTIALMVPRNKLTGDEVTMKSAAWTCTCNTSPGSCKDASSPFFKACDANSCKSCTGADIVKNKLGGLELAR
jgi:hypothetical protein